MDFFDLEALARATVHHEPFTYVVVPGFLHPTMLPELSCAFPAISSRGNFSPEDIAYGSVFERLVKEVRTTEFQVAFARRFAVELSDSRLKITLRGFVDETDSGLHPDTANKIVTALIYLNESWPHIGGRLRLTRSAKDFGDYVEEVAPVNGNLVAFVRADNSYHGFLPFVGKRRSLQLNWTRTKSLPV